MRYIVVFCGAVHSAQTVAIIIATGSVYTHCGIVLNKDGKLHVFEASRTVRWTPLNVWIANGVDGHYVLTRPKNRDQTLTPEAVRKLHQSAAYFEGRPYDLRFQWTDNHIYCSELIWKMYKNATGRELHPLRPFRDYNLDHPIIRKIIKERYGEGINLEELATAPADILESPALEVIGGNQSK